MRHVLGIVVATVAVGLFGLSCASSEDVNLVGTTEGGTDDAATEGGEASTDSEAGPPADVSAETAEATVDAAPDIVSEPEASAPTKCTDVPGGSCDSAGSCATPTGNPPKIHWDKFDSTCTGIAQWCCGNADCPIAQGAQCTLGGACYGLFPTKIDNTNCGTFAVCCGP